MLNTLSLFLFRSADPGHGSHLLDNNMAVKSSRTYFSAAQTLNQSAPNKHQVSAALFTLKPEFREENLQFIRDIDYYFRPEYFYSFITFISSLIFKRYLFNPLYNIKCNYTERRYNLNAIKYNTSNRCIKVDK